MNMPAFSNERLAEAVFRVEGMSQDIQDIKVTLKEMATAVQKLAVVEERQTQDRAEISRIFKRLEAHDARIQILETAQPMQRQASAWIYHAITVAITAAITLGATYALGQRTDSKTPAPIAAPAR